MKIILLGTGGPRPDPERQGSGLILTDGHAYLLFDAGRGVSSQLVRAGLQPQQIDPIFITHHHFDHIANLGDVILSSWNNGRTAPLLLGRGEQRPLSRRCSTRSTPPTSIFG